ncbi:MAG: exo-alpha-sialidase, partial [Lentisphaeria bacterium]|nr:exo-alpha-sialidase [Lentisphaeria bacterium]
MKQNVFWMTAVFMTVLAVSGCRKAPSKPPTAAMDIQFGTPQKTGGDLAPSLVVLDDGTLVMIAFRSGNYRSASELEEAIFIYESRDDGQTWSKIAGIKTIITQSVWGRAIATDGKRIHFAWVSALPETTGVQVYKAVMLSHSDDGGRTWTKPVIVNTTRTGQRRNPAIAANGSNVCVAWLCKPGGRNAGEQVFAAVSMDGGASFSPEVCAEPRLDNQLSGSGKPSIALVGEKTYCVFSAYYPERNGTLCIARNDGSGPLWPSKLTMKDKLVDEVSAVATGEKLRVLATLNIGVSIGIGGPAVSHKVYYFESDDGGENWTEARVDDDSRSPPGAKWLP